MQSRIPLINEISSVPLILLLVQRSTKVPFGARSSNIGALYMSDAYPYAQHSTALGWLLAFSSLAACDADCSGVTIVCARMADDIYFDGLS